MSVHYKFKSALEYDTVTFDGLHISVKDLKKAIIHQKRIGKNTDFDLQVTNAQTKEVYNDENALIPKNTSLVIARIPMAAQAKGKPWEGYNNAPPTTTPGNVKPEEGVLSKAVDLTQLDAPEDQKILAMINQSTVDYDPSNYVKFRGSNQVGVVPSHYRCFKCHQPGHWIKDCPLGHGQEPMEIKKSTGIPRSFMVPVEGPMVPGAMMTPTGQYAVPVLDHQAYNEGPKPSLAPQQEEKPEIPEDLLCSICKDLLTDAVMIPCCGNSFCDECIRTTLLESEDHECPDCHEKEISPGTLIPNRFLRNAVSNFKNETGYHKRITYRNALQPAKQEDVETKPVVQESVVAESTTEVPVKVEDVKPDSQTVDEPTYESQKPVISEADSTETSKAVVKEETEKIKEGPPGVESPETKPTVNDSDESAQKQGQAISSVGSQVNHHRVKHHSSTSHSSRSSQSAGHENSSRHISHQTLQYDRNMEERPGTPTVDEPGSGPPGYPDERYSGSSPPGIHSGPTTLPPMHPPIMSGNPGQQSYPPSGQQPPGYPSGPPSQSYRMPPPGHPDYNRLAPGSAYQDTLPTRLVIVSNPSMVDPTVPPPNVPPPQVPGYGPPPRQIFDPSRPPVGYDPHRPPHSAPPPGYPYSGPRPRGSGYPPSRHLQPPPPGMNHRPPPMTGIIDDPLEAFNRMLREKDERDRRARQARRASRSRSYSRSRSRSRSSRSFSRSPRRGRSRTPTPVQRGGRHRSRTRSPPPRRRPTRSRSRSFSISRSRSFSRSPSFRGSPPREYSPRRRPPSRYRSPLPRASPPRYNRYKENRPPMSERDRLDRDLGLDRDRISRVDRSVDRLPEHRERDYSYYDSGHPPPDYDQYDQYGPERSSRQRPTHRSSRYGQPPPPRKDYPPSMDQFYQPPEMCPSGTYPSHSNRYSSSRGPSSYPPPLMSVKTVPPLIPERQEMVPPRRYDDIGPPGLEQPPPPGFENPRYDVRFSQYDRTRDDGPPGVDRYVRTSPYAEREEVERERERPREERPREPERRGEVERVRTERPASERERRYSPSPEHRVHRSPSPKRHSSKERYVEKARKKHESSERDKRDSSRSEVDREKKEKKERKERDKDRDVSDDEKIRKSKDKKKKKAERKEAERKKKKEKKEKKEQEKLKKAEEKKAKEATIEASKLEDNKENEDVIKDVKEEAVVKIEEVKQELIEEVEVKPKVDLYDDILTEGIDNNVVAQYGKIDQKDVKDSEEEKTPLTPAKKDDSSKSEDEEEKEASFDGIELQVSEAELKISEEIKPKANEVLAPVPELSKWERDEENAEKGDSKSEIKQVFDRPNKMVTSEVLKRAENAIFAKAINAIRPIEIKKISQDRAKLYSGEKPQSEVLIPKESIKVTIPGTGWNIDSDIVPPGTEPVKLKTDPPPNRLSVKERLGCKVEELDKLTKEKEVFERNRSRTLSPLSRRQDEASRNVGMGERRVEVEDRRRDEHRRRDDRRHEPRHERDRRHRSRSREHRRDYRVERRRDERDRRSERSRSRNRRHDREEHERYRERAREDKREREKERRPVKKSRSRSRSDSREKKSKKDQKKSKDKKHKKEKEPKEKEKVKKNRDKSTSRPPESVKIESKVIVQERKSESSETKTPKQVEDRRKPTLDEANFEPDYDLDTESEKEEPTRKVEKKRDRSKSSEGSVHEAKKKPKIEEEKESRKRASSTSSASSSSSSENSVKHKKKHKKHRKKKARKETSSSSSDSESDSSVEEKKKKKHKNKKQKKRKKSKHK